MSIDEELLKIERERLASEERRDKYANIRFFVGSVLVVLVTAFLSFFQQNKAIKAQERHHRELLQLEKDNAKGLEDRLLVEQSQRELGLSIQFVSGLNNELISQNISKIDDLLLVFNSTVAKDFLLREKKVLIAKQDAEAERNSVEQARKEAKQSQSESLEKQQIANLKTDEALKRLELAKKRETQVKQEEVEKRRTYWRDICSEPGACTSDGVPY